MTNFLINLFVKDNKNINNINVRNSYGKLSGTIGIFTNIFLSLCKIISGLIFSNVSITADGINNLSDAANSIITLIGFKLASKPADKDHPFGHARYEYLTGMIISFLIMFLGFSLLKEAITKIFNPEEIKFSMLLIIILSISIIIKLWLYFFNKKIANKINSITIMATAKDSLNDVISTSTVLVSILAEHFLKIKIDGFTGTLVSLFVIYSGYQLINEALSPLLGEAPKEDLVKLIEEEIPKYPTVIGIHDLVVHNYGQNKCFITVHVEIPAKQDILISHDIVDNIEMDFYKKYNLHLVIHMDPVETENKEAIELKNKVSEKITEYSSELSIHDFRVVFGESHNNLIFDILVPTNFELSDEEIEIKMNELVKEINLKNNAVIRIDKKYHK